MRFIAVRSDVARIRRNGELVIENSEKFHSLEVRLHLDKSFFQNHDDLATRAVGYQNIIIPPA